MNNKCNIFQYSPKELTTDAFFTWLFYFLDSDNAYSKAKQQFFRTFLLKEEDKTKNIENIKVFLQEEKRNGRTDLQVSFNFEKEKERQTILFENKTWSETSVGQLNGYKSDFPDMYKIAVWNVLSAILPSSLKMTATSKSKAATLTSLMNLLKMKKSKCLTLKKRNYANI